MTDDYADEAEALAKARFERSSGMRWETELTDEPLRQAWIEGARADLQSVLPMHDDRKLTELADEVDRGIIAGILPLEDQRIRDWARSKRSGGEQG